MRYRPTEGFEKLAKAGHLDLTVESIVSSLSEGEGCLDERPRTLGRFVLSGIGSHKIVQPYVAK